MGSKRKLLALALLLDEDEEQEEAQRKYSVSPINQLRPVKGEFNVIFNDLLTDPARFKVIYRMRPEQFYSLHEMVKPFIAKKGTASCPISTVERLSLCLQYLGAGCSAKHLGVKYRMGHSTVIGIIDEVCEKIWTVLAPKYLQVPKTKDEWLKVAEKYEERWNLPHCLGSIDGKHIRIKSPPNTGSVFFNYKKFFSIVLLAIVDPHYKFLAIDVGAAGSQSDSGIFGNSLLKTLINANDSIPVAEPLDKSTEPVPFFFVGDDGFPASEHLLKPYGGGPLSVKQQLFNFRLSRARRCVENSFGILSQQWRCLLTGIESSPERARTRVMALCCLHNFLNEQRQSAEWTEPETSGPPQHKFSLVNIEATTSKNSSTAAKRVRDTVAEWCSGEGRIDGQMSQIVIPLSKPPPPYPGPSRSAGLCSPNGGKPTPLSSFLRPGDCPQQMSSPAGVQTEPITTAGGATAPPTTFGPCSTFERRQSMMIPYMGGSIAVNLIRQRTPQTGQRIGTPPAVNFPGGVATVPPEVKTVSSDSSSSSSHNNSCPS